MALPIAHHEFPRKSAGFGNGPDGSGGLKEKRFGLAPDGLCSGTGGWSVGPTWAFFGARAMGFWWDFRRRRSPEVLEYLGPSTSSSPGSPSLSESKDRGMPEVPGGLPEAEDLCNRECSSGWLTSKRCKRQL